MKKKTNENCNVRTSRTNETETATILKINYINGFFSLQDLLFPFFFGKSKEKSNFNKSIIFSVFFWLQIKKNDIVCPKNWKREDFFYLENVETLKKYLIETYMLCFFNF